MDTVVKSYSFEALGLLHNGVDESLFDIIDLASSIFDAPVTFASVLEKQKGRQYIAASKGAIFDAGEAHDMPIESSICKHVQASQQTVAIPDLLEDPRTRDNEFVIQNGLRSYIGCPVHTLSGKVIGALCCMTHAPRDWTPKDRDILEKLARCVDDIVKARTLALEERKMREALQETLASRSGYIAHASHEIRTPLTSIIASVKMLDHMELEGTPGQLIQVLNRSTSKLLDFVNDALDLAKIDAGHSEVPQDEACFGDLVREIVNEFTDLAESKSVDLTVADHLADKAYLLDTNAVRTIMQNLIGNALKFTDTGSVKIALTEDSYGQVVIDVIDTGIGIAPENQAKIFEEFGQADPSIAQKYGGTGLGMAIVKRTVDRLDGFITVDSQLGEGTKFSVAIPVQAVDLQQSAA
ncbi:GAF domain-containing sensor histidine kinase [Sulfitobacter sabulilitoris]|uniref:histidine kinase n=1 Tax=Sulfitobacter sabulilitoris TaxID=2562655 RepID=A0A5S3PCJ2_9RHOB|nr:GAF domain-containing sensor histidine kinase [Sulfitobacter sabulilitoris]TMM51317.1 GAF domain-containing sensor histidine kinase [Sulfitobacter sabulilitoris]